MINGQFYDEPESASRDEIRLGAEENLARVNGDESYMAADVLVLSKWLIRLLDEEENRDGVDHKHDWRVDPDWHGLSLPPSQRLVCVVCGESKTRPVPNYYPMSTRDPKDWPRA